MKRDSKPLSRTPRMISNRWAHRAPLFAVVFVTVATLFPYQFLPHETAHRRTVFFLLWLTPHPTNLRDFLENVLLFVPLGFGFASWAVAKEWRRLWGALAALVGAAAFSSLLEFLQVFLPTRTAEWWDVIANSIGTVLGFLIFQIVGERISSYASALEDKIERTFTSRRIAASFVVYSSLMLFCSARLQQATNLTQWHQGDTLFVGNDATDSHPWHGRILHLEMADGVVSPDYFSATGNAAGRSFNKQASEDPHVVLDLSARGDQTEENNSQEEGPRQSAEGQAAVHIGMDSIRARIPATAIVNDLKKTNRFALRVLCIPSEAAVRSFGTIVSLSSDPRHPDFFLHEERERWVVGIHSALGGKTQDWDLQFSNIPTHGEPVEFSITYDGSELVASVNGEQSTQRLSLNPGASLVRRFKGVGTLNVHGYGLVYDGIVFVPLGFLLALATRNSAYRSHRRQAIVVLGFLLPPIALEVVLTLVSRRPFRAENVILGICLILGAFLIWNAHRIYTAWCGPLK